MGQALYRKYRSKNLSEIIGQEHITSSLHNALKSGSISHAYLLTGPRGVGKTSIARILAHEVNGLPYDEDANHLDIIEIDAASNRRIDEIRELRERVHTAPATAKYKVYIIDEVHMLTKEAFNALLKTLEEPPAHVIFILATTEAHKLPETIVSRTQRFTFKPIDQNRAVEHLRTIATNEGIDISDDALKLIATHGGGSFRDSISLLDQASTTSRKVGLKEVQSLLGIAPDEIIEKLLNVMESGTPAELDGLLRDMRENGYSPARTAKQLSTRIRQKLLNGSSSFDPAEASKILNELLHVSASHDPETSFEIALLSIVFKNHTIELAPAPTQAKATQSKKQIIQDIEPEPTNQPIPDEAPEETVVGQEPIIGDETPAPKLPKQGSSPLDDEVWHQALEAIKKKHNTLYGVARMARATVTEDEIDLCFKFAFHQKRINEAKNKQVLVDIIQEITGKPVKITCSVDKNMSGEQKHETAKPRPKPADSAQIDTISNIFGSAEVIE